MEGFFKSTIFFIALGLEALTLALFFILKLLRGISNRKSYKWHEFMGLTANLLIILGFLTFLLSIGWFNLFSKETTLTLTEGERQHLGFDTNDSLYLYKSQYTLYHGSQSINEYQALVISFLGNEYKVDTIRTNSPLVNKNTRIHITDYGFSQDSLYLNFRIKVPWGDTIKCEFPPEGVITDQRFPLYISFENFWIDRSSAWPNPEVPVVTVNLMLPGELISKRRLRAPDTISAYDYTLFFDGIKMRPTATFHCVRDKSWIGAIIATGLMLLGLLALFISRIIEHFGRKK